MPTADSFHAPTSRRYADAIRTLLPLKKRDVKMLRIQYEAFARTITARQLAQEMGFRSYSVANLQYGRLGRLIGEQLEYDPEPEKLGTLVMFD
ncbi:MAG: hypothetical protein WKF75_19675, partial [Singulisphaera sp.]